MADFELVYEVRIPVKRGSYAAARALADKQLIALREDIETGDPDGPRVTLQEVKKTWSIPACTCLGPRDRYGQYHLLDCAISREARDRHGRML